jgi:hypothetical protein
MSLDNQETEAPVIEDILDLIEHTIDDCASALEDNTDPDHPELPKLRWIGAQMHRVPFEVIWTSKVKSAYHIAKDLGYIGEYEEWEALIRKELEEGTTEEVEEED